MAAFRGCTEPERKRGGWDDNPTRGCVHHGHHVVHWMGRLAFTRWLRQSGATTMNSACMCCWISEEQENSNPSITCAELLDLSVIETQEVVDPCDEFASTLGHDVYGFGRGMMGWLVLMMMPQKNTLT